MRSIFVGVSAWADDGGASQIIQTFAVLAASTASDSSSGETEAEKAERGGGGDGEADELEERIKRAIEPPETQ